MLLPRLFRTSSFRLTLLYAVLFVSSVLVLFTVIYWSTSFYMTSQLDAAVESDLTELTDGYRAGSIADLTALVAGRVQEMPAGPILYLLEGADGKPLAGNLPPLPMTEGTLDLDLPRASGSRLRAIHGTGVKLPDDAYLLVAADAHPLTEMREMILKAFAWGSAVSLLLAIGGGALMSGGLVRRVETINRTVADIMEGDLTRRIPVSGGDDEFDHLAANLNAMLARLEASIEAMRQVSNDIAHDLRTPLTRLRQRLDQARRRPASAADLGAAIERSIADTDAILETFGALLRIAQIESGAPKSRFAVVGLSDLLHTVMEVFEPMAEEKQQSLTVDIAPGLAVAGDRELLARMFANLVENAIRHSPPHAAITLAAARETGVIAVVLADRGPGIPEREYANVFRRFYRLDASRTTPGSGLGLSLVAAVAGLHGIDVALSDNRPGLYVRLRFPGGEPRDGLERAAKRADSCLRSKADSG